MKLEERGTQSFDLALLHERPCHIYAKSQGAVGGFKPPFLSVIEVKLAYGSRSVRFSIQGTPSDIQKLWAMRSAFDHAYVVVVDFFEKRSLATIRDAIRGCNGITVAYIGLDHSEVLKPENEGHNKAPEATHGPRALVPPLCLKNVLAHTKYCTL